MEKYTAKGYYEEAYPPMPTKATRFWRKNFVWQFIKFVILNFKVMRIVVRGHS